MHVVIPRASIKKITLNKVIKKINTGLKIVHEKYTEHKKTVKGGIEQKIKATYRKQIAK